MKKLLLVSGFLIGILLTSSSFALSIQRNVRMGAAPVDGPIAISRYAGNILQDGYDIGIEKQGYYETKIHEYSYKKLPEFVKEPVIEVKTVVTPAKHAAMLPTTSGKITLVRRTNHRLSLFRTREERIRNGWDKFFE